MDMENDDGNQMEDLDEWVVLLREEAPVNPRLEYDMLSVFLFQHQRYNLGDDDAEKTFRRELDISSTDIRDLEKTLDKKRAVWTRVYLYDHGGVTISRKPFSCPFDSGLLGVAAIFASDIREAYNCKKITQKTRGHARDVLNSELDQYNQWINGDVWGYEHYKRDINGEPVVEDSCWGFYGFNVNENGMKDSGLHDGLKFFNEDGQCDSRFQ
jgi:hypothetical protein